MPRYPGIPETSTAQTILAQRGLKQEDRRLRESRRAGNLNFALDVARATLLGLVGQQGVGGLWSEGQDRRTQREIAQEQAALDREGFDRADERTARTLESNEEMARLEREQRALLAREEIINKLDLAAQEEGYLREKMDIDAELKRQELESEERIAGMRVDGPRDASPQARELRATIASLIMRDTGDVGMAERYIEGQSTPEELEYIQDLSRLTVSAKSLVAPGTPDPGTGVLEIDAVAPDALREKFSGLPEEALRRQIAAQLFRASEGPPGGLESLARRLSAAGVLPEPMLRGPSERIEMGPAFGYPPSGGAGSPIEILKDLYRRVSGTKPPVPEAPRDNLSFERPEITPLQSPEQEAINAMLLRGRSAVRPEGATPAPLTEQQKKYLYGLGR